MIDGCDGFAGHTAKEEHEGETWRVGSKERPAAACLSGMRLSKTVVAGERPRPSYPGVLLPGMRGGSQVFLRR